MVLSRTLSELVGYRRCHAAAMLASLVSAGCGDATRASPPAAPPQLHASRTGSTAAVPRADARQIKVLAINDFHGQLESGLTQGPSPAGGAAVLAAYLREAGRGFDGRQLYLFAGDSVGASPPISGVLQDEPTILFLNQLVNTFCKGQNVDEPRCNGVATLGNHEFDEGVEEMRRLIGGGVHAKVKPLQAGYDGANFPYVCSNVIVDATQKPLLAPYAIREIGGARLGVIGAVTHDVPRVVVPTFVDGLTFDDEAVGINRAAAALKQQGIRALFVVIHEGDEQLPPYEGTTIASAQVGPRVARIVSLLDEEIDVVVTGHAHGFTNAYTPNRGQRPVLVTQAFSKGRAFAEIDVTLDPAGDVAEKSAKIVVAYGDRAPGTTPEPDVAALVKAASDRVSPITSEVLAHAKQSLLAAPNEAGESLLGYLLTDAQRAKFPSDLAMTNAGGIRADLPAGEVTWGHAYAVQPFGNHLVRVKLTGEELQQYLEQQVLLGPESGGINAVSGLSYVWDPNAKPGQRVSQIRVGKTPLEPRRRYTMTVNAYLSLLRGERAIPCKKCEPEQGPLDLDALVDYLTSLPQGFEPPRSGRIQRLESGGPQTRAMLPSAR